MGGELYPISQFCLGNVFSPKNEVLVILYSKWQVKIKISDKLQANLISSTSEFSLSVANSFLSQELNSVFQILNLLNKFYTRY